MTEEITMGADLMVAAVVVILTTTIILLVMMFRAVVFSRASTAAPSSDTSSVIASSSSGSSWKYDVFLSFRGEDTRKTFVDHLYSALQHHNIHTYKDDVTLDRGDTIGPSLLKAIRESHIALIVFSKNYADSSWCLDELAYIMKCKEDEMGKIVIPIFYDVDPSDVRKQKGQFRKAFYKHNNSANKNRVESWRKALGDASNIVGWEPKLVANGHEAKCIKEIVSTVLDKLMPSLDSVVEDENLVGMGTRLQDLKSQLEIGSRGVHMVGIWGVGGGGKTTLATSLFIEISGNFDGCCFHGNIREESNKHGLKNLQEKILSTIFDKEIKVQSVDIGKHTIKRMLCRRNVLIVLDDVDDLEQLEALAGSPDWFGDGSRIIITTRDEHLLTTHRVDKVYPVRLLSHDEAMRLFKRHAYCENNPVEDYDKLSFRVISYVNGLPLALKILGSFLYGKDKNEWISALDKLREIPNRKVTDQLKISYDGLEHDEKEIFLDVACFFRGESKDHAMAILDACGFHPHIGIKVLIQKALITISSDGRFDMHDLLQEMGHHIVRGEHPNNLEKHSRLWRCREISDMCSWNATMQENHKIEAVQYINFDPQSPSCIMLLSNLKKLRFLDVTIWGDSCCDEGPTFLSNELKYMKWNRYPPSPFPESFQPRKLVVLKIDGTLQRELWKGYKYMPCLKELKLIDANALFRTPDIGGLSCLKKLIIRQCESLEEIDPSLGNHASLVYVSVSSCKKLTRFPSIVRMEKLEILEISSCQALLEFPKIEANMDRLANLTLEYVGIEVLPSSVGRYCTNLISLRLYGCSKLKSIEGNFHALKHLQKCTLVDFQQLENLPKDLFNEKCCLDDLWLNTYPMFDILPPQLPRLLRKLSLNGFRFRLKDGEIPSDIGELSNLQELHLCNNHFSHLDFSLSQLTRLKLLNLSGYNNLVELPELPSNLCILQADNSDSLEAIRDDVHRNCKWLCQVSIISYEEGCCSFVGGERLLETMLQGVAIEHHQCMSLHLKGIEIPKGFEPRLVRGDIYRLKLPKNWFDEYTGFLFCSVLKEHCYLLDVKITMRNGGMGDSQDEQRVFWSEESVDDDLETWVGYVSFGSLRCTAWWDQTSTAVDFSIDLSRSPISGFGVRLVSKKNQMKETTTTTNSSSELCDDDDDYECKFNIRHDSRSLLECQFGPF